MSIQVLNVTKKFGSFTALQDINFEVATGELVALLGPSGSGKTSLLRVIAGLERAQSGRVMIHGNEMTDKNVADRKVGFVFQHYALFRHMTVFENIAFGLRVRPKSNRPSEEQIKSKVDELLKLVRLENMANRFPSQLSGGQRQRVALARALAIEPQMLLLDEPFGSLDANVRRELRQWLRQLHDRLHMTSVFVTHDQEEALEVADRVVVMNHGKIEQIGTPDEVYHKPATPFVYHFLGNVNLFHCRVERGKAFIGDTPVPFSPSVDSKADKAKIFVRPHLLEIERHAVGEYFFKATVRHVHAAGPVVRVEVTSEWGDPVLVEMSHDRHQVLQLKQDEQVFILPKETVKVFTDDYAI